MQIGDRVRITDVDEDDAWFNQRDQIIGVTGTVSALGNGPGAFGFYPDKKVVLYERLGKVDEEPFTVSPDEGFFFAKASFEHL